MTTNGSSVSPHPPPLRRNREFLPVWSGHTVSRLGSHVAGIALPVLSLIASWIEARAGRVADGAIAIWALAMPLQATAAAAPALIAGAALADMMIPVYNMAQISYRLALIPDQLQGRVNSAYRLPSYGSGLLGTAGSGLLGTAGGGLLSTAGGGLLSTAGPPPILWPIAIGLGLSALVASVTTRRQA